MKEVRVIRPAAPPCCGGCAAGQGCDGALRGLGQGWEPPRLGRGVGFFATVAVVGVGLWLVWQLGVMHDRG